MAVILNQSRESSLQQEQSGDAAFVKQRLSGHEKKPFEPKFTKSARKSDFATHSLYNFKDESLKESNSTGQLSSPIRRQQSREKYFTS
jgi:hypothetical protein